MAVTPATWPAQTTRLGCGRDVDEVWQTIDQPPNEHERRCPSCKRARVELAELAAATHDLSTADQQDDNLRIPDQMLSTVLAIVRTEVRRGRTIPLQRRAAAPTLPSTATDPTAPSTRAAGAQNAPADAGTVAEGDERDVTVSELVIATVVRETCDRNPDVEVRRVSIDATPADDVPTGSFPGQGTGPTTGPTPAGMQPADVSIDLQAAVSRAAAIPALISGLRAAIRVAVAAQIGITVSRINVDVQDLIDA